MLNINSIVQRNLDEFGRIVIPKNIRIDYLLVSPDKRCKCKLAIIGSKLVLFLLPYTDKNETENIIHLKVNDLGMLDVSQHFNPKVYKKLNFCILNKADGLINEDYLVLTAE